MNLSELEREYLKTARIGHLATADTSGRPHVVPVCFAVLEGGIYTPIDEKPKQTSSNNLRRIRDIKANSAVALIVDHYTETWDQLGWLQVRGTATIVHPADNCHSNAIAGLRSKYDQYKDHTLEERPIIQIEPGHVISWGKIQPELLNNSEKPH